MKHGIIEPSPVKVLVEVCAEIRNFRAYNMIISSDYDRPKVSGSVQAFSIDINDLYVFSRLYRARREKLLFIYGLPAIFVHPLTSLGGWADTIAPNHDILCFSLPRSKHASL